MSQGKARVIRWSEADTPEENQLQALLQAEGLTFYSWGNAPGDRYAAHVHAYHKVIYIVSGSIRFILPEQNQQLHLQPGDRLELPAGVVHAAEVGPEGVRCLEAHR